MKIEQYNHSDPGYNPIFISDGWQVGQLNFTPELQLVAIDRVERHLKTDEVFILFKGNASLIAAVEALTGLQWEILPMRAGITYNIPAGLWHNIAMMSGSTVMILEKNNTHLHDVEYRSLTDAEQTSLQALLRKN